MSEGRIRRHNHEQRSFVRRWKAEIMYVPCSTQRRLKHRTLYCAGTYRIPLVFVKAKTRTDIPCVKVSSDITMIDSRRYVVTLSPTKKGTGSSLGGVNDQECNNKTALNSPYYLPS